MSRLIVVSNRLPFSAERSGDSFVLRQSSGGLVSALKSYFEKTNVDSKRFKEHIWVGSVDFSPQIWRKIKDKSIKSANFRVEPIYIEPAT